MRPLQWAGRLAGVIALFAAACGGGEQATPLPDAVSVQAPSQLEPGEAARFDAIGIDAQGTATGLVWRWSFGDGQTSTEASPTHRYAQPGRYELTLSVSNGQGQVREARRAVTVGHFERLAGRDCSGSALSGWCWQMPARAARTVLDTHFVDANQGLAVGELGLVASTADGGRSWSVLAADTVATLQRVRMADALTAYAVTDDRRLLRSRDGGRTWEARGQVPMAQVDQLWLVGAETVVISGRDARYLGAQRSIVSSDGGAHWRTAALRVG